VHVVLATNADASQPWVAEGAAQFARKTGATVTVVSVDEVELERLAPAPRRLYLERAARPPRPPRTGSPRQGSR
jgi:hypothetical protein